MPACIREKILAASERYKQSMRVPACIALVGFFFDIALLPMSVLAGVNMIVLC
jgi:hypothetical protein